MKKQNNDGFFSNLFFDLIRIVISPPGFLFFRVKVLYENKAARKKIRGGAILASNHLSYVDPVYLMYAFWYRRIHFVTLKELFNTKAKKFWFTKFKCIPIDRENFNMSSFKEIVRNLKANHMVGIFPEGRILTDKNISVQDFKSGMVLMALQSGKPIVQACIRKKKHWWDRIVIAVSEPVDVMKLCGLNANLNDIDSITKKLHDKEEELCKLVESYRKRKVRK